MFLDDGFACGDNKISADIISVDIKRDILDSGFVPKADKCFWVPVQELQWLGALLNSVHFTISIPQVRIDKALACLDVISTNRKSVPVRKVASFVGQMISMSIVVGSVSQIMTRYLSIDIAMAPTWNSYIKLSCDSREQLLFWKDNLRFWCYQTAGVDAFTFDWGNNFGLFVPPSHAEDIEQLPDVLVEKVSLLPDLLKGSRADSTCHKYKNGFLRWEKWALSNGLNSINKPPREIAQGSGKLNKDNKHSLVSEPLTTTFYSD
ncbi:hypothetical protein ScPMuIL_017146 [Solemya velum]